MQCIIVVFKPFMLLFLFIADVATVVFAAVVANVVVKVVLI